MSEYKYEAIISASQDFDKVEVHLRANTLDDLNADIVEANQGVMPNAAHHGALLAAGYTAAKGGLTAPAPVAPQAPPAQQYNPVAEPQQAQAPQYAPPPQQQQPAFQGGVSPQQNVGACVKPGCGQPLERKNTTGGKPVLRCPNWRWGNNEGDGHTSDFL